MASTFVDALHAGGQIVVGGSGYVGEPLVHLAIPGREPVALTPDEARALAYELRVYAAAMDNRKARAAAATANPGK